MRIRLKRDVAIHKSHGLVKGLELEAEEREEHNGFGRPYVNVVAPGTGVSCRIWPHEYEVVEEDDARQEDVPLD